ncbi:hypothetical protein IVB15_17625 [Bradyrhizobium sp. 182]|uniref:hypothetical protein n=1 Tax=unclassified Bradyrhizobium TaxID=2631580 RepID=UPI001FF89A15|nr:MULTISPECIES: hypothetical protein [unclassified Bradyrhizobium]MCK1423553.1 hypothetical protein [Bradyrhizobium sp. CW12]MCK1529493.1 hypothetical protein [Bradyrhizobium sp. 182]MCK1594168.1 hypothetical protein [Bradyrhizobium sp. 164]MCK1617996.1 hypothetical protein [Bradyrhizobium sp. 159]MCK1646702.1 hypothetical protein [Bradyrhizobium sp. 154]
MNEIDRLSEFLQRLTPMSRSCLLSELERLELCGIDMPGSADIQSRLRAEFRKDGSAHSRATSPSRYFFAPLELLLIDGAPEHANAGRISRNTLTPIWEWICRDLLPTMARDYIKAINDQIAANNLKEVQKIASTFQTKVLKVLESTLASADSTQLARAKLAQYTASRTAFDDVMKMLDVLRAGDALPKFNAKLPERIAKFDDNQVAQITWQLDAFGKSHPRALPFALTLVARRLKTPWQLVRLATKAAASKSAADVAAAPYACVVPMVLDRLDDKRLALRVALRHNRVLVARDLLAEIYDTEYALKVRIDGIEHCDWGIRLQQLMDAIAALVSAEVSRFPANVGHILGSRRLRSHDTLGGKLTYLAWKGRDAMQDGAAAFRKLIGQT